MLNIIRINLKKKENTCNARKIKTSKHFPSSTREWNNSIYVYNKKNLDLIPSTMLIAMKIIKSYFSLYNYRIERKIRKKKLALKFKRLCSNKIYISNGEFKHTNNKVSINLYVFNRQKYNYIIALKKLFLKTLRRKKFSFKKKFLRKKLKYIRKSQVKYSINKTSFISNLRKRSFNVIKLEKSTNLTLYNLKLIYLLRKFGAESLKTRKIKKNYLKKNKSKLIIKHKTQIMPNIFNKQSNIIRLFKQISFTNVIFSRKLFLNKNLKTSFDILKQNILFCFNMIIIKNLKAHSFVKTGYIKVLNTNFSKYKRPSKIFLVNKIKKLKIFHLNISRKKLYSKKLKNIKRIAFLPFLMNKNRGFMTMNNLGLLLFLTYRRKLLKSVKRKKYLIIKNLMSNKTWYITKYVNDFYKKLIRKSFKRLKLYVYYRQLIYINRSKYNYGYLQYLTKHLYNLYNKNVEYNLINLKRMHLHSDILTESLMLKLTKNKARLMRKLKHLKRKIRIRKKEYFLNKRVKKKTIKYEKTFFKKEYNKTT